MMRKLKTMTGVLLVGGILGGFPVNDVQLGSVSLSAEAEAATLFERLFRKRDRRRRVEVVKPAPVKIVKKVSAPKYFTYKPTPLRKSKFGKLAKLATVAAVTAPPALVANLNRDRFSHAIRHVSNYTPMVEKSVAKAVLMHYTENSRFLWVSDEFTPNENAKAVLGILSNADAEGLSAAEYFVELPGDYGQYGHSSDFQAALVRFEFELTMRAMRYATDASRGRVNPNKLSGYHDIKVKADKPADVLAELAASTHPANYLLSRNPDSQTYRMFKQELATVRNSAEESITFPAKVLIKPGQTHEEFPKVLQVIAKKGSAELKTEFAGVLGAVVDEHIYAPELVPLIKAFQKELKLRPDGVIGRRTVGKMADTSKETKIQRLLNAMERLRWHPSDFGSRYVFINQPAYRASYHVNGEEKLSMRAIVGKRSNQTSFFNDEIESVVYNPYWGVPRSILVNEMLPKLRADPTYLDARGYEITTLNGRQISSSSVDWYGVGSDFGYNVRQTPGPKNALGELKILFPNKHAIYMHDTPGRHLFKKTERALSHGCVRLQNPRGMAAAVLGTSVGHITAKLGGGHSKQRLPSKVPVYVTYFTAWPDAEGQVKYFHDIYGRDAHLTKALEKTSSARRVGV